MAGDSRHEVKDNSICSYHMDLVDKMGQVSGKLDLMNGMLTESLVKQEGLFKKLDEHTKVLNTHSEALVRNEHVASKLDVHEKEIQTNKQDIAVLRENKNNKTAIIAVIFTALVNALFIGLSKVLGLHHNGQ